MSNSIPIRGLAYMNTVAGVCHRDIKPQNILVDPLTHQVKICDFGSAKVLVKGEANISYICSRYYRAPELIFGTTEYSTSIDIWSVVVSLPSYFLASLFFLEKMQSINLYRLSRFLVLPLEKKFDV